ncbi:MAG: hypothetical protein ACM3US_06355 [Sphingomonadaceae bacterium]
MEEVGSGAPGVAGGRVARAAGATAVGLATGGVASGVDSGRACACRAEAARPKNPRVYSHEAKRKSVTAEPAATFFTSLS